MPKRRPATNGDHAWWLGMWHGGHSYSSPEVFEHGEAFRTIADAADALSDRYRNGDRWQCHFPLVFGEPYSAYCPGVTSDSEMWLYRVPRGMSAHDAAEQIERDGYPDRIIRIGPREGIRVERA
jgi:hypothetical protein